MPASVYVLAPNSLIADAFFSASGTTNIVTALSDNTASTSVRKSDTSNTAYLSLGLTSSTIGANEIVWRVRTELSMYQGAQGNTSIGVFIPYTSSSGEARKGGATLQTTTGTVGSGSVLTSVVTPYLIPRALIPLDAWFATEQGFVDPLEIYLTDQSASGGTPIHRATFGKISASLETTLRPTASVTGIDSDSASPFVVTTTTRPTLTFTYAQTDSIAAGTYQVAVFTAPQTDPNVSGSLVYRSDIQYVPGGSTFSQVIGTDLTNGASYWAYARAGMTLGNGYVNSLWGSGTPSSQLAFSVSLTPPVSPSVTTSWNSASQFATLTAQGASYGAGTQTFRIQRQEDTGDWVTVRNGGALTPSASFAASVIDYETSRGARGTNKIVRYRAISDGLAGGSTLASNPSTTVPVAVVTDGQNWFKNLTDPTLNRGSWIVRDDVDFDVEESVEVVRPLGRSDAVIISGAIGGDDGTLDLVITSVAQWTAARNLFIAQNVLLWQDPFGEQKYIRPIRRSWTKTGGVTTPRWNMKVDYIEVASP